MYRVWAWRFGFFSYHGNRFHLLWHKNLSDIYQFIMTKLLQQYFKRGNNFLALQMQITQVCDLWLFVKNDPQLLDSCCILVRALNSYAYIKVVRRTGFYRVGPRHFEIAMCTTDAVQGLNLPNSFGGITAHAYTDHFNETSHCLHLCGMQGQKNTVTLLFPITYPMLHN